jgi:mannosyl-3-phosphoglycerate phosphatase
MVSENVRKENGRRFVIFTDLDDTLLDENYEYRDALPALHVLKEKNVPIIFCSAKTFAEQQVYRKRMGLKHPFIVENGSAIYIPRGYFKKRKGEAEGEYEVILLGVESENIKKEIESLRTEYYIKSYCNMTAEEVANQMNLDWESAKRAKDRQFTETVIEADEKALEALRTKFNVMFGGRAIEVSGKGADKGKAVRLLAEMYRESGRVVTIGLGNSYNDEPMLKVVDVPVVVKNPDGSWVGININGLRKASEIGPKGWRECIRELVLGGSDD